MKTIFLVGSVEFVGFIHQIVTKLYYDFEL